jgi:rRNA maturation protein Nop10
MDGKRTAIFAVLIVVVIVAAVIIVKRTTGKPAPPAQVMNQQVEKIDIKSLEVTTARLGAWGAPNESGLWKNPKTGEYTMADAMKCAACGKPIPVPEGTLPGMFPDPQTDYKCPRCGENAFRRLPSRQP